MMKKRKYLITGASGFIGSCLLRELVSRRESVHVFLRKGFRPWRIKDLLAKATVHFDDLSCLEPLSRRMHRIRPDVIYHLATYGAYPSQNDAELCIQTNFIGSWNLLKATVDIDYELFVNTGSSSEYGFKDAPMKETDLLEPASYYAVTKSAQTLLCSRFAKENKKPIVTLRPFSVYGPYEDKNRFVPTLLRALRRHQRMDLVNPKVARDWIYVDDMVRAYLLIDKLKKHSGEIFNIGTGKQNTIQAVVDLAVKAAGRSTDLRWGNMPNRKWDSTCWVADIAKARKMLGWRPQVNLRQGLALTWKWLEQNNGACPFDQTWK